MSKRKRKAARRQLPPRPAARVEPAGSTGPTAPTSGSGQRGFNPDYSYIVKDLKRIGILAAGFITILVVLSFFLG